MKTQLLLFSMLFILSAFPLDSANAQLGTENILRAPFISEINAQSNMQSIMQNSEKDIVFIENLGQIRDSKGQARPDVLFLTRSQGVDMYITSSGITYVFRKTEADVRKSAAMRKDKVYEPKKSLYRLDMEFVGMNKNFIVTKEHAVEQRFNYYTPEYPNGISLKGYKKIIIENIYEGIDLVYYEKEGKMKYDFIVKSGADANKIKMKYKGAGNVYLDKDGSVRVTTPLGEIKEEKPFTYSSNTGIEIESVYKVKNNVVQFGISEYYKSEDIIIDPYRMWATYYGGSDNDYGSGICTDNEGNIYVTGGTSSTNFPIQILSGSHNQTVSGGLYDAFILKFNSSGTRIWATYYGGSDNDYGSGICTDNLGDSFVMGYTYSTNFPVQILTGAYNQTTHTDSADIFILKFNNSGARIWATYYGGGGEDYSSYICMDTSGNLYLTGSTSSTNFPLQNPGGGAYFQGTYGGGLYSGDAYILKFDYNCSRLWATYYGGDNEEVGSSICTDNAGNIYVTGSTASFDFPTLTLTGAYNQTYGGVYDAFILKFNNSGTRLWATYYGGNMPDFGYSIITDHNNNILISGGTGSTNFPLQNPGGGAYFQGTYGGGFLFGDAFILKFNSNGVRQWATYYGGDTTDVGTGICTDNSGNVYVIGWTNSTNFPIQTLDSVAYNQTTIGGGSDAIILKFSDNCERIWATYYGGSGDDLGITTCTDNSDYLYVSGATNSTNFPIQILDSAYNDTTYGGGPYDAFILKFSPTPIGIKNISYEIPEKYSLHQNYPNPFNPTTNIRFEIPRTSLVKLIVYDILGKEITTLVNEKLSAGSYEVSWDGSGYPSGVYFYKLITDEFSSVKKMILLN